jgi:UDP-N-acetylmuramoyl-L-alanyl-D-glutamate--2,6-diaminopimelate ligase
VSTAERATALRPRASHGVQLAELIELAGAARQPAAGADEAGVPVTGMTLDSRLVVPGDLYVALPGRSHHGAKFAEAAARAGAVAVLTDVAGQELAVGLHLPVMVVDDPRRSMARVAARIYGNPSAAMTMFGVTGTNGKTTTSFLLDAALRGAGRQTGVIGTIGFLLDGMMLDATRTTVTTPEAPELQALLAVLVEGGAQACVMEVSSHALALGRTDAVTFDVAAFTNLGRDHLDFHGDEESYFEAKARLFTPQRSRAAVINIDDVRGPLLLDRLTSYGVPGVSISLHDSSADYTVRGTELRTGGLTKVVLQTPDRTVDFHLGLPGEFNVRNAVTALAMADVAGIDLDLAAQGLTTANVPGRMQRVALGTGAPAAFVDFAHTPQAVTAALAAVAGQRRIVVLGCGGDRDPEKRGPMGAAAATSAEIVVVTDDNPRSEDPATIRREVLSGAWEAKDAGRLGCTILDGGDRRSAIRTGLELGGPADVVVILGKGHETGQEVGGAVLAFSDVDVVRQEWTELSLRRAPRC